MARYRIIILIMAILVSMVGGAVAVELTFNSPPPTVEPSDLGTYYDEINNSNLSWPYAIAPVIPKPIIDSFDLPEEIAWQIFWLWIIGLMFLILFARQRNVFIPLIVFIMVSAIILQSSPGIPGFPAEHIWIAYAFAAAATLGVILYIARKK